MRASRMPTHRHTGVTSLERSLRLRSARDWVFRLAECPQASSLPLTSPSSCELSPGHPLGPFARVTGVCSRQCLGALPLASKDRHRGDHRIPLRDRKTVRTRPHIGAGRGRIIRNLFRKKRNYYSLFKTCSRLEYLTEIPRGFRLLLRGVRSPGHRSKTSDINLRSAASMARPRECVRPRARCRRTRSRRARAR